MHETKYLSNYHPPSFRVKKASLKFELNKEITKVNSHLLIEKLTSKEVPLELDGENLELLALYLNGKKLEDSEYEITEEKLILKSIPSEEFVLEITNEISPQNNTKLEGLYVSDSLLCTQNEPQGFRRITYFIDRPDNLTLFTTTIIADKTKYPILLSNGNTIEKGEIDNNKHYVIWQDPHPKPSYLFALVAGDLGHTHSTYTTKSDKLINLYVYCDKGNEEKTTFALKSLKNAMKWDEENFERECDVNTYMIVAVDAFNQGAMENKGLNIFNSQRVLAHPTTTTDEEHIDIEEVVGHEYFHNWTGNRVTCRDWFQLTLKEGLTIFRDQEFSRDMRNRDIQRIKQIETLKSVQFREDASPHAHPIQPKYYIEINNFYTPTVYLKGAEVIRMLETIVGKEGFKKGMLLYFQRHDGKAITTNEFVEAIGDANSFDVTQFKKWYDQVGTPNIHVKKTYDEEKKLLKLTIQQKTKTPLVIPLVIGFLNSRGEEMNYEMTSHSLQKNIRKGVLILREQNEMFEFEVKENPYVSCNRDFSAPIKVSYSHEEEENSFMITNETNGVRRYELIKQYYVSLLKSLLETNENSYEIPLYYKELFTSIVNDETLSNSLKSLFLTLPSDSEFLTNNTNVNPLSLYFLKKQVHREMALSHKTAWEEIIKNKKHYDEYSLDEKQRGDRAMQSLALSFLKEFEEYIFLIKEYYDESYCITEKFSALKAINNLKTPLREEMLNDFYSYAKHNNSLLTKYFFLRTNSSLLNSPKELKNIEKDPCFGDNPNILRGFMEGFVSNSKLFHKEDGSGYDYFLEKILQIDNKNPMIAAKMIARLNQYENYSQPHYSLIKEKLLQFSTTKNLSKNTYEMVSKMIKI